MMNQKQYGLSKEIMSLGVMIVMRRIEHGFKAVQSYFPLEEDKVEGA